MTSDAPPPQPIPTIDLAPFRGGDREAKRAVADAVAAACREVGFLVVSGHRIPPATFEAVFDRYRAFTDLPAQAKQRWHPRGPARQRGYHAVETRGLGGTLGPDAPPDLRESIFLGPVADHRAHYAHLPEAATAYAPNILPDVPAGLAEALIEIYRAYEQLAQELLAVFAVALDLPEDHFAPLIDRHFSILGAHHYPPLERPPAPGQLRCGAHTDFGALTILAMTQGRGGLEARMPDGGWVSVQPGPGELVVNLGDMMERWTNERWISTLHRVAIPPALADAASRRMAVGYFMHPNFDAEVCCIPSCLEPGATPRHPPITAGEHIRRKIDRSHERAT
jgi:isopenicillin N synthase-like dioxygenase